MPSTIADEWESLRSLLDQAHPMTPATESNLRNAFYAGVCSALTLVKERLEANRDLKAFMEDFIGLGEEAQSYSAAEEAFDEWDAGNASGSR